MQAILLETVRIGGEAIPEGNLIQTIFSPLIISDTPFCTFDDRDDWAVDAGLAHYSETGKYLRYAADLPRSFGEVVRSFGIPAKIFAGRTDYSGFFVGQPEETPRV